MTLGQVAYGAYGDSTGWLNYQGAPMLAWAEMPERIREAWEAAASAVAARGAHA